MMHHDLFLFTSPSILNLRKLLKLEYSRWFFFYNRWGFWCWNWNKWEEENHFKESDFETWV